MKTTDEAFKQRLSIALKAANSCMFEVDIVNQCCTFIDNTEAIFGKSGEQILGELSQYAGLPPDENRRAVAEYFVHPDDEKAIAKAFRAALAGRAAECEARMRCGAGQDYVWCRLYVAPVFENGVPMRIAGAVSNIPEAAQHMIALEKAANLDSLTGLYTRERCAQLCAAMLAEDAARCCALLMVDLDGFKAINDEGGHMAGDEALLAVAAQLRGKVRRTDVVARFGADEFVVFMQDSGESQAMKKARELLAPCDVNGRSVTKSIGVAVRQNAGEGFDAMLERAAHALGRAKLSKNTAELDA